MTQDIALSGRSNTDAPAGYGWGVCMHPEAGPQRVLFTFPWDTSIVARPTRLLEHQRVAHRSIVDDPRRSSLRMARPGAGSCYASNLR